MLFLAVLLPANLVNSNEVRAVRRSGNVNNGANAGPCYFNANNAVSNANWNYGATLTLTSAQAWPLMRHPRLGGYPGDEDYSCASSSVVGNNRNTPAGAA